MTAAKFPAVALALIGCAHIGPKSVAVDRFDCGAAIGDSWKQPTLLNTVRLPLITIPAQ